MANYHYDEAGNMALYYLITFLSLTLIPWTISGLASSKKKKKLEGCQCKACVEQRRITRKQQSFLPSVSKKSMIKIIGWALFAATIYRVTTATVAEQKLYDPFEILGIKHGMVEKEIKRHYKQLSRKFHPDKVRLAENQTIEEVEAHFVDITKAYKALTDEDIRKNWELYGHPDGRQEISMGIAIPEWVVKGENNIWVLGVYGLLFGGALPAMVGRWWFGKRKVTKDGVNPRTATAYFKSLKDESSMDDVVSALTQSVEFEEGSPKSSGRLGEVETAIQTRLGEDRWKKLAAAAGEKRKRALVLLFAHLLRVPLNDTALQTEQRKLILQTPTLLNSLLSIVLTRNWLSPSLAAMRLHAYITQALQPGAENLQFAQLPDVTFEDSEKLGKGLKQLEDFSDVLAQNNDPRLSEVRKAEQKWGRLELVEAGFKVIGEKLVTPQCIVHLVVKLRISPPSSKNGAAGKEEKATPPLDDDEAFLIGNKIMDPIDEKRQLGAAHAPYWPGDREPSWWLVLGDEKSSRVVVPPLKITNIPVANPNSGKPDYRRYKMQFQAPGGVGLYTWKIYLVSDTFVGGEIIQPLVLKIDQPVAETADAQEDDISDPEEDSLAGQMALMRGGSVKKIGAEDDDSDDDESGTDDDKKPVESDSDSDSD